LLTTEKQPQAQNRCETQGSDCQDFIVMVQEEGGSS